MSLSKFDGLLSMLDELDLEDDAMVKLRVQLKFLRMIIRWGSSWIATTSYDDVIQQVTSHVADAYAEMQQPYETRDSDGTLRNLSRKVEGCERMIWLLCKLYNTAYGHCYASFGTAGDGELGIVHLLKQLADPLLGIIAHGHMVSRFDDAPSKQVFQFFQEKLEFVRNCLVKCRCLASAEDLDRMEMVFENALFVCSLVWWGEYQKTPLVTL